MQNGTDNLWRQINDMESSLHVAYIKPLEKGAEGAYAIHAADGRQLAVFDSYDSAFFTARQHNLCPVSVH